jgi:hypothetical protein
MRYISLGAAQTPRGAISRSRLILGKRDSPHEVQVFVALLYGNHSVPHSSDHEVLSSSEQVEEFGPAGLANAGNGNYGMGVAVGDYDRCFTARCAQLMGTPQICSGTTYGAR